MIENEIEENTSTSTNILNADGDSHHDKNSSCKVIVNNIMDIENFIGINNTMDNLTKFTTIKRSSIPNFTYYYP